MSHLVEVAVFTTFAEASACARSLANQFKEAVEVRRSGSRWSLRADSSVADSFIHWSEEDGESDSEEGNWIAEANDAELPIGEEVAEDQEQYASSEEEGWFYPDEANDV